MEIYWFVLSYMILGRIFAKRHKKIYVVSCFVLLILVAGLRNYSIGIDLERHYARNFSIIANTDWKNLSKFTYVGGYDMGFVVFCKFISYLSSDPQCLIMISSIITFGLIGRYIYLYSDDVALETFLFFSSMIYFMYLNIVAQALAIAIVVLGLDRLVKKQYLRFILCDYARSVSSSDTVIVERKLEGREYTAWYALADGNASLINFASMYNQPGYPSNCYSVTTTHTNKLDRYLNEVDPNFKKALKESGCKEGIAWIEMMLDKDGHFYVLETGYRMSGDMMARVHKNVSNFDTYAWLVDIASGKKHTALDLPKSQDEEPQRCGCSYILWSEEEGTISRIEGLSEIKNLPGININIDGNLKVGNRVSKHQYLYVITFDTENISKMCNVIEQINNTVKIFDQQNNDIVIRYTDFNSLNAGE